jgi:hypothetical protein
VAPGLSLPKAAGDVTSHFGGRAEIIQIYNALAEDKPGVYNKSYKYVTAKIEEHAWNFIL